MNAGTLLVNGTIPGPVTVNAGGTLGGTGTVSGSVTVNAGGTLAPGLSPGITNTGNLVLAGIFLVEIEGADARHAVRQHERDRDGERRRVGR